MTQPDNHHNGQSNGQSNGQQNGQPRAQSNGQATDPGRAPDRAPGRATSDPQDASAQELYGTQAGRARDYPLSDRPGEIKSAGGRTLEAITLEAAAQGDLSAQDLQIGADTLLAQAAIARQSGFRELADNLTRAAELTAVPNQELLRMYEQLRPHRATYTELMELAHTLETDYHAPVTAEFVREAAQVYQTRNLLRRT